MHILLLNWRDPKNPKAGGAEKLNLHLVKPLLERGDSVTWYAQSYPTLPKKEVYKGVTILRKGNVLTHFLWWPWLLWNGSLGKVDVIIDSIHGTGYLSSVFATHTKKIILICEVAQNIWDEMYPFPLNIIGKLWEKFLFSFYKRDTFWTISESTKKDLIRFGVRSKFITVLPMGFDGKEVAATSTKYKTPTALFVGRIAEMKGILDAIKAIENLHEDSHTLWKLRIIGRGEPADELALKHYVKEKNLSQLVTFLGYVTEDEKFEEMAKAWVLLVPSSREGWGMIVPEANAVGTPAIGYNVPGLADVLPKSARENIVVEKGYEHIAASLRTMKEPTLLTHRPKPGWRELEQFVVSRLNTRNG